MPIITSISPVSGYPGPLITITGENFDENPQGNVIVVGSVKVPAMSATSNSIVVAAPKDGKTGNVVVKTSEGLFDGPLFRYHEAPKVGKPDVTFIDFYTARLNVELVSIGSEPVVDCGFLYSKSTIDPKTFSTAKKVSFGAASEAKKLNSELDDLEQNQTYYARAYCLSDTMILGEEINFSTLGLNKWNKVGFGLEEHSPFFIGPQFGQPGFVINDKAYLIGEEGYLTAGGVVLAVKEFDEVTQRFRVVNMSPIPYQSGGIATAAVGDTLFVICDGQNVWKYNVASKVWISAEQLPVKMGLTRSFLLDNQIYLVGLVSSTAVYSRYVVSAGKFSYPKPITNTALLPVCATSVSGHGFLILYKNNPDVLESRIWLYNPSVDSWTMKSTVPDVTYSSRVFILSGLKHQYMFSAKRVWQYLPEDDAWIERPPLEISPAEDQIYGGFVRNDRFFIVTRYNVYVFKPE